ncbi:hypothetical protein BJF78_08760 [Pseudonocardia sp. CNS-139]|nr:hypothetical protein BJF78_08760 [Pseudonocardia sp. CNS-139]
MQPDALGLQRVDHLPHQRGVRGRAGPVLPAVRAARRVVGADDQHDGPVRLVEQEAGDGCLGHLRDVVGRWQVEAHDQPDAAAGRARGGDEDE